MLCPSGQVARTGKDVVFGDGVLWRTGRRAGHEGVPSQNAALVFQGILPRVADCINHPAGSRCVYSEIRNTHGGGTIHDAKNELHT